MVKSKGEKEKNLFIVSPLISFQDLRCDIFSNDLRPSEGHSVLFYFIQKYGDQESRKKGQK